MLAGAGFGIVTGIIEGQTKKRRTTGTATTTTSLRLSPTLAWLKNDCGDGALVPGFVGRF